MSDYKQKEPTKTERMLYELAMAQNQMEKGLWSTSTVVMALATLTKQEPSAIANLMVNGDDQLKEFSNKVNEEIKKLESAKHPTSHKATSDEHDHKHEEKPEESK